MLTLILICLLAAGGLLGGCIRQTVSANYRTFTNQVTSSNLVFSNYVVSEMRTPRVREIMSLVASNQASEILRDQINPVVQEFQLKLAERIQSLEATTAQQLADTKKLALPPTLALDTVSMTNRGGSLVATLSFRPSRLENVGVVVFVAKVTGNADSRILDFRPTLAGGPFGSGPDTTTISANGKEARVQYALMFPGNPTVELTVSHPATVQIGGNHELQPFELSLK
jgi:hypothetical protein